jgi:tRNA (adenine57-N1/adenine58-N1)-methyltransferase
MPKKITKGDPVVLTDRKGNKILLTIEDEMKKVKGLGVYNPGELVGRKYYDDITIGNRTFLVLEPSISDKIEAIERKAQIILPKDGMFVLYYCNIKPGDIIIEAGTGSGSLTILLAHFVGLKGKVISYEKREDHIKVAKRNLTKAHLSDSVEFKKGDVTKRITEKNVDSIILDIPNPWDALNNAYEAVKQGGHVAVYTPTVNQFEKTQREMEKYGLGEKRTIETIQREMVVGERGVRPSFDMLGHTGYLTFSRKII